MVSARRPPVLGKIAAELERAVVRRREAGSPGGTAGTRLAAGPGWSVYDVLCTYGPGDRPFEERHGAVAIAVVIGGTFHYRTPSGHEVMTPGSLLLGDVGQPFECGHEHGAGDRCVAFRYEPGFFEQILGAAGGRDHHFRVLRLPPLRETAPLVARAVIGVAGGEPAWEELALEMAAAAVGLAIGHLGSRPRLPARAIARVTQSVRAIDRDPAAHVSLARLAADAGLSPYHYLRTFTLVTGVTPHQFIVRARLREAAARLARENARVIDVAFESGFNDISNFNRAFRSEFGVAPLAYRRRAG
ncbi:MAG TPA: AraC family transcriptional regulator [Gemmatimonadales bacterium]|nr:AraC family transcriptional regulator [Gemmatimonadales bacterium]